MKAFQLALYGTLQSHDILRTVIQDSAFERITLEPVDIDGTAYYVRDELYPMLLDTQDGARSPALLVRGLTKAALSRLDFFEESSYQAKKVTAYHRNGEHSEAYVYAPTEGLACSVQIWRLEEWEPLHKTAYLNTVVIPWMAGYTPGRHVCMTAICELL